MTARTEFIATHTDAELKEAIVSLARFDRRSVSAYVEQILLEHVARRDRQEALKIARRAGQ